jgi:hypothetical protein
MNIKRVAGITGASLAAIVVVGSMTFGAQIGQALGWRDTAVATSAPIADDAPEGVEMPIVQSPASVDGSADVDAQVAANAAAAAAAAAQLAADQAAQAAAQQALAQKTQKSTSAVKRPIWVVDNQPGNQAGGYWDTTPCGQAGATLAADGTAVCVG